MSYCPLLMKTYNSFDLLLYCGTTVLCLNRVILIRTVSNLFTILSTKMSFPSFNIVYTCIAIFLQKLLPFVHEMLPLFAMFTL